MNSAFFILTILGCGDGEMNCVWVQESKQRYLTLESCRQNSEVELLQNLKIEYPVTVAVCKSQADLDSRVDRANILEADKPEGSNLAANTSHYPMKQSIVRRTVTKLQSQTKAIGAFIKRAGMALVRVITPPKHRTSNYNQDKFTKVL